MLKWLLRLVFIRLLGRRAVPILALLGLVTAIRGSRRQAVDGVDPRTGRVHVRGESGWR
ncbi:MAG TPA: hypothetical protein VFY23_04280 [Candidatus Limnocylindrales bacterium]|nr:hypothetical protein [Candidatus Limnocylindrales bacterium]